MTRTFHQGRGITATFTTPIFTDLLFVKKIVGVSYTEFLQIGGNVEKKLLTPFGKLNAPLQ
jgi:hypothetical protein